MAGRPAIVLAIIIELLPPPAQQAAHVLAHATLSRIVIMEQLIPNGALNGIPNGLPHSPSAEELERELSFVNDGQVPLGELVSRTAQAVYAELTELAET